MEQKRPQRGFWYILGPLVLYWIVNSVAVTLAESVLIMKYVLQNVTQITNADAVAQFMTDHMDQIYEIIAARSVELTAFGAAATLLVTVFIYKADRKKDRKKPDSEIRKVGLKEYGILLIFGVAVCIALNNLINMAGVAFYSDTYQEVSETFYSAGFAVQILCLGIIIPVSEEFLFRGLVFCRYRKTASFMFAMLYSAIFFAVTHGNMVQVIYAFVLGIFLAYVYEKYGTILAPVCLHVVVNLASLLITKADGFTWMFSSFGRLGGTTIGSAFIAACVFTYIQRMQPRLDGWKPKKEEKDKVTPDMFR